MTATTALSAADLNTRDQGVVLAWLDSLGIDPGECCGLAFIPSGSPYLAGELVLTFYDLDADGRRHLDADRVPATYQERRELPDGPPDWWSRLAKEVT